MAVFRVERNTGYTVMSNHHLRNKELTLSTGLTLSVLQKCVLLFGSYVMQEVKRF